MDKNWDNVLIEYIPKFIKKIGFAWFYRFIQEPRRLFRDSILYTLNIVLKNNFAKQLLINV